MSTFTKACMSFDFWTDELAERREALRRDPDTAVLRERVERAEQCLAIAERRWRAAHDREDAEAAQADGLAEIAPAENPGVFGPLHP